MKIARLHIFNFLNSCKWICYLLSLTIVNNSLQPVLAQASNSQKIINPASLQLPSVFGSHMVLQRNKPIKFYGISSSNREVSVEFNNIKQTVLPNANGKWEVQFPEMQAGGPFEAVISNQDTSIIIQDILIGEVWLCSGQSNMAFPLAAAIKESGEMANAQNNYTLRLLNKKTFAETDNKSWDKNTLHKINQLEYFSGAWNSCDSTNAKSFSAVAYFFGKALQEHLKVPIGLIQVAVGGSPIESWLDRNTMEKHPVLAKELKDWRHSALYQPWVKERAEINLKIAKSSNQKHPFEPCYNFEAGIQPLTAFPIAGVIWYQGESNAHNASLYEIQFKELVKSWRKQWGFELPFYFVQLSSINRELWPEFRFMQFQLSKQISNTGMAVSSDWGDFEDVYPKNKKPIGKRLALLALAYHYKENQIIANGPEIIRAERKSKHIILSFKYANLLKTSDGKELRGFKLLDEKGEAHFVKATIRKNKIIIKRNKKNPEASVLYAWEPYTDANLVNEANLPASTFKLPIM